MSEKMTSQKKLGEIKLVPYNKPHVSLSYVRICPAKKMLKSSKKHKNINITSLVPLQEKN